ncbi:MAG: hypothetical protein Q7U34_08915 [Anaerolineales bacterium]|nr:hypothetical protein [Anaerolineales bacterium]
MNGLALFEQDDAQCAVLHFGDASLTSNPPVSLAFFPQRISDDALNPFIPNHNTVGTLTGVKKVLRHFHGDCAPNVVQGICRRCFLACGYPDSTFLLREV